VHHVGFYYRNTLAAVCSGTFIVFTREGATYDATSSSRRSTSANTFPS